MRKIIAIVFLILLLPVVQGDPSLNLCRDPHREIMVESISIGESVQMCSGQVIQIGSGENIKGYIHYELLSWPGDSYIIVRTATYQLRICSNHQCGGTVMLTLPVYTQGEVGRVFAVGDPNYPETVLNFEIVEVGYGYIVFTRF
ncbi:TPA_asm: hypothetical protein vir519_00057 [Caudoviricetes sp. vir519]|nr:TPA_asm: hypothetical protein vir519_00057 [Caudoviricetes sp. vir519]